jgi:hypothetical protein
LGLWLALPPSIDLPIPKVSWALARELRRMEKRVDKLQRRFSPSVADVAQDAFEAIKILAPGFDRAPASPQEEPLREAALIKFPKLLDNIVAMPPEGFSQHSDRQAASPASALINQLLELRGRFQQAANELLDREFQASYRGRAEASPEMAAWQEKLRPRLENLKQRSGPGTLGTLQNIEEKLAFLLERIGTDGDILDLRPFEVRKIAFEYLPDAIDQYLQLPASMARTERLNSGKTAEESLNEQLGMLDTALYDLSKSLFEKDAGGLLVHGRFLKEKFAEQPFRLLEGDPPRQST